MAAEYKTFDVLGLEYAHQNKCYLSLIKDKLPEVRLCLESASGHRQGPALVVHFSRKQEDPEWPALPQPRCLVVGRGPKILFIL